MTSVPNLDHGEMCKRDLLWFADALQHVAHHASPAYLVEFREALDYALESNPLPSASPSDLPKPGVIH